MKILSPILVLFFVLSAQGQQQNVKKKRVLRPTPTEASSAEIETEAP